MTGGLPITLDLSVYAHVLPNIPLSNIKKLQPPSSHLQNYKTTNGQSSQE